jgi:DNA-binding GntR family transcriptional regulator
VGQAVQQLILDGELRPGQRLIQQSLAKRFGVSQSVMREALLEAEFTGLVESMDRLGAFVAAIDEAQLLQAYEIREVLEGAAARSCCDHASTADVREFRSLAEQIHKLGVSGNDHERAALDRRFHERVIEASGNVLLRRLSGGYHVVRLVVLKSVPHDQILRDHLDIVEAIEANKPDEAERAARRHVVTAKEMVQRQIHSKGFMFPWQTEPREVEKVGS